MKKISVIFALLALSMFALILTAAAQNDLPAINEEEAADYLGIWYMDQLCEAEQCFSVGTFGMNAELNVNADNTITMTMNGEKEENSIQWYMKEGSAYIIRENEDGTKTDHVLNIDEKGALVLAESENSYATFVREQFIQPGSGEVVTDATYENFAGKWYLYGIKVDDMVIPTSLLGLNIELNIDEEQISIVTSEETQTAPYTLEEGKLTGELKQDENTNMQYVITYHDDVSLVFTTNPGTEDESLMIFSSELIESDLTLESLLETTGEAK